jgi:hypothetical protein
MCISPRTSGRKSSGLSARVILTASQNENHRQPDSSAPGRIARFHPGKRTISQTDEEYAFFIHKKTSGNSRREDLYTPKIIQITSGSVKGLNQNDFSYLTRSFEICY